jgi:hypothetical protein
MSVAALAQGERIPLLPRGAGSLPPPPAISLTPAQIRDRLQHLQTISDSRKRVVKAAALICSPISIPCTVCCGCLSISHSHTGDSICCYECERQDSQNIPYCQYTSCESSCDRPCWRAALPPITDEDKCDLCSLVCDPCIFCFCCDKASPETYLTRSQREEWRTLQTRQSQIISQPDAPLTQVMQTASIMNPDLIFIRNNLTTYLIPEVSDIALSYLHISAPTDTRSENSRPILKPTYSSSDRLTPGH